MKKIALIAIVVVMVAVGVFALTSCAKDIQLDEFDTLTVATNAEFSPLEYMEGGEFLGVDMDIIREIGKRMGKKVKIDHMDFDAVIAAVSSGKHLVSIAGLTINEERSKAVSFSDSYIDFIYQVIIVKESNTVFDDLSKDEIIKKLSGTKIHVAKGQVGQFFAQGDDAFGYSGIKDADVKIYDTVNLAAMSISGNEVAFSDNLVAKEFCESNSGYKYIDVELTSEQYGIAVAKSNKTLLKEINKYLAEIKADGTYDKIVAKYVD